MYAEIVVDRPIIKQGRRDFVEAPDEADTPYPELAEADGGDMSTPDNPLALTFHYSVPPHLVDQLQPGHWVAIPFRSQQLTGLVVSLSNTAPIEVTKPIATILDPTPVVTPTQLRLARWLADETLAPLASCVKLFLPPGSGRKSEFVLKPIAAASPGRLNAPEQVLLSYLQQQGSMPLAEAEPDVANVLLEKGLVRKEAILSQPRIGPKIDRTVELLIPAEEVEAVLPTLGRASKPADLLLHLANLDDPLPSLAETLAQIGCSKEQVRALAQRGWVEVIPKQSRLALAPAAQNRAKEADNLALTEAEQGVVAHLAAQSQPRLVDEVLSATATTPATLTGLIKKELVVKLEEAERITLTLPPDQLTEAIIQLHGSRKQAQVLRLLAEEEGPVWVGWVYAQTEANLQTLKELAGANLISMEDARRWRDPLAGRSFVLDTPPTLSEEQQTVWQAVGEAWQKRRSEAKPILIHGVTGSGKTEIYLRAIAVALKAGYGAIMLVPEITLATQTVARVASRFPGQVAVWHSALAPGERYDTWERVRQGDLPIVVGPRSALFAPVQKLGVVIVDEEHEPAYKQRDRLPIFHARETAVELGRLCQALVILGSATPDVVSYRKGQRGEYHLLSLPYRILAHTEHVAVQQGVIRRMKEDPLQGGRDGRIKNQGPKEPISSLIHHPSAFVTLPLPEVEIVDLREELKAGNRTIFSRVLQDAMRETLRREEQIILFLNRRGTASFVICRDCGYVARCPRCDTTLTYHASGELMVCHFCGHRERTPERCPQCHSERIRYFGLGTQRVEEAVKTMFPQAQVIRWDWDTTRQQGSHDIFLQHFLTGQANVMVGTQMVAKGLDLPLVTLVGVISADTALYLPDFRAAERTFQLLMQVAGRAGRSPLGGRVIIQTYNPDQVAIQAASQHDYLGFYETELAFRQEQRYPPFKRLALLLYSGSGPERSAAEAHRLAERLRLHIERRGLPAVEIIGPTPDYVPRVRSQYRWHILLRAHNPAAVLHPLLPLPQGWRVDIDPVTLL